MKETVRGMRAMQWRKRSTAMAILPIMLASMVAGQGLSRSDDPLKFSFDGKRGQVEVGGPYVGMEFHESRPVPSRISFYYPVANSIDLSTDYWKRGQSLPMALGVRFGTGPIEWVQNESWSYVLSPHKVTFKKTTDSVDFTIRYEFCMNQPAAVVQVRLRNRGQTNLPVELYTHLVLSIRTCQTYARKDSSLMTYDSKQSVAISRFEYVDTDSAAVFVQNVGEHPIEWTTRTGEVQVTDVGGTQWPQRGGLSSDHGMTSPEKTRGIAAFVFRKSLAPGDSLDVVQIVGSCRENEVTTRTSSLRTNWREEVRKYDAFVHTKAQGEALFKTGDKIVDRSAIWARALIATNAHYLDGRIVPMPCPAEYNFFFTHDLLLTNLGAVNFDLQRVKSNLLYVVSMAKDSVIPHAFYWRDDGYKTEYCEPENWNHLWFVLVSGAYLRHSLDDSTGMILYPFLTKSVHALLTRLRPDGLMYAYRPDWWDIGHIEGPRSYLTALTVRALREYLFISSFLKEPNHDLKLYEQMADTMQHSLVDKLWDDKDAYLMNYNAGEKDRHYYAGSLIASVYNLLDRGHARELVTTATKQLVDERIGLRIAMPPDFSSDSVIRMFKFAGDEAGPPYSYANGGVWPHGNAWYAMALSNVGRIDDALEFAKRTMTIDGIADSPNGLPAMYEYRSSNPQPSAFGTIDKPSFLWAGGMYLQVLYRVLAIDENEWNIGIRQELPSQFDSIACSMTFGGLKSLSIHRVKNQPANLSADGRQIPSRILPLDTRGSTTWSLSGEDRLTPVLVKANVIVYAASYDIRTNRISCDVSSFDGHSTILTFESRNVPKRFAVDGRTQHQMSTNRTDGNLYLTTVQLVGSSKRQRVTISF